MQIAPRSYAPPAANYAAADKLLDLRDLNDGDHTLLRENLAAYHAQMPVDPLGNHQLHEHGRKHRWAEKTMRDMNQPYTDTEVFQHAGKLERLCKDLALHAPPHQTWHVFGSLDKYRFGANSDLDLLCNGTLTPEQIAHINAMPGWTAEPLPAPLQTSDPNALHATVRHGDSLSAGFITGPRLQESLANTNSRTAFDSHSVAHGQGFLTDHLTASLQTRGFGLTRTSTRIEILPPDAPLAHAPEIDWRT